jgi:molybdate transport system regulatory protein
MIGYAMARAAPLRLFLRLELGEDIAIGPGKADLLAGIAETGSIAAAARRLGMSYKRAWLLVETMNACFRAPLVLSARGGRGAGGARLTVEGEAVLAAYRSLQRAAEDAAAPHARAIARLARSPKPRP